MTHSHPTYHLEVYGCQMNIHDSENIAGILEASGYTTASSIETADVILVVTCAVREHAEVRALGRVAQLGGIGSGGRIMVLCGCVAQEHGDELLRRLPALDLVVGPDNYSSLPSLIEEGRRLSLTELDGEEYENVSPLRMEFPRAFVTVMRGCDNFCSYCIVPFVRGREHSRSADRIVAEVKSLADDGYGEITLLGQNVNSYRSEGLDFPGLLRRVSHAAGSARIRFVTSHPKDCGRDLASVMASSDNVCAQLHLPVQSGSDSILELMNRGYTRSQYLDLIDMLRTMMPGIVLSTDVITGFPGETEQDFEDTISLLREVRFDYSFLFKYSERSGTTACDLPGSLPEELRLTRLNHLQEIQREITVARSQALVGSCRQVLVTGPAKKPGQQSGRTEGNRVVILEGTSFEPGNRVDVLITRADGWTHFGVPLE